MLSLQSPQQPDPGKREPEDGISLLPRPGELTPGKAGLTRPTYPPDSDSLPPTTPSLGPGFALRPLPCSVPGVSEGPLPLPPWARRSPGSPWTVVQSSLLPSLPLRPVSAVAPASMLLTCGSLVSGHPPPKRPPPKGRGVCQFTARSPGPGWPQQGLQHLVRQGGGGGKGEGGQAAPHLTGHPSPHAGCLLTARTPAATAPSDFSVGRGVACAGPDKCPPRAGDRAVPRTSASRRLGRAGGRHPPGAEDNFIKLDLIKEQTAFKTNLKSMDVHTHPPTHFNGCDAVPSKSILSWFEPPVPWKWLNRIPPSLPGRQPARGAALVLQTCWAVQDRRQRLRRRGVCSAGEAGAAVRVPGPPARPPIPDARSLCLL